MRHVRYSFRAALSAHMKLADVMLFLGMLTSLVLPVLDARSWTPEGFEDDEGFHFGPRPQPIAIPVETADPEM